LVCLFKFFKPRCFLECDRFYFRFTFWVVILFKICLFFFDNLFFFNSKKKRKTNIFYNKSGRFF
jgi:hypothetical protein